MSEMARELGFPNLQQTDIDKFYTPDVHGTQHDLNAECQRELLRVLKNSARLEPAPIAPPAAASSAKALADLPPIMPTPKEDKRPLGVRIFDPPDSK